MATQSATGIFQAMCASDYSEPDFIAKMLDLQAQDEDVFVECFLQFILDCTEIPIQVTLDMYLPTAITSNNRSDDDELKFMGYAHAARCTLIERTLKAYVAETRPYKSRKWIDHVLNLLQTMMDVDGQIGVSGMFFAIRILFECTRLSQYRMGPESCPFLLEFCSNLLALYDFDLLVDQNYLDIAEKLNFIFLYYGDTLLAENPSNARHLTNLLLIDNNPLKVKLLKTIEQMLSSTDGNRNPPVHDAIMAELITLKDVLLAICHNESAGAASSALGLLIAQARHLLSDPNDRDKVFLLMTNTNKKIQGMSKQFFIDHVSPSTRQDSSTSFLKVLEAFVSKYEDAFTHLPVVVAVLLDDLPSFVDIYLYIVRMQSKVISLISTIMVRLLVDQLDESPSTKDRLGDIIKITGGALRQLPPLNWACIYQHLVQNMLRLTDTRLELTPPDELKEISEHLLTSLFRRELPYDGQLWVAGLLQKIATIESSCDLDYSRILNLVKADNNLAALGALLESENSIDKDLANELFSIEDTAADPVHYTNVMHLIILATDDGVEVVAKCVKLLQFIELNRLHQVQDVTPLAFKIVLKSSFCVCLKAILNLKWASSDQLQYLTTFETNLFIWISDWISRNPRSDDWQDYTIGLMEFSRKSIEPNLLTPLFAAVIKSPRSRHFFKQFLQSMCKNRFMDLQSKIQWLVRTVTETLLQIVDVLPNSLGNVAAKVLKEVLATEFVPTFAAEVVRQNLVRILKLTALQLSNNPDEDVTQSGPRQRLKVLDVLMENQVLVLNKKDVPPSERTAILQVVAKVGKRLLSEPEITTLRRIVLALQ